MWYKISVCIDKQQPRGNIKVLIHFVGCGLDHKSKTFGSRLQEWYFQKNCLGIFNSSFSFLTPPSRFFPLLSASIPFGFHQRSRGPCSFELWGRHGCRGQSCGGSWCCGAPPARSASARYLQPLGSNRISVLQIPRPWSGGKPCRPVQIPTEMLRNADRSTDQSNWKAGNTS